MAYFNSNYSIINNWNSDCYNYAIPYSQIEYNSYTSQYYSNINQIPQTQQNFNSFYPPIPNFPYMVSPSLPYINQEVIQVSNFKPPPPPPKTTSFNKNFYKKPFVNKIWVNPNYKKDYKTKHLSKQECPIKNNEPSMPKEVQISTEFSIAQSKEAEFKEQDPDQQNQEGQQEEDLAEIENSFKNFDIDDISQNIIQKIDYGIIYYPKLNKNRNKKNY